LYDGKPGRDNRDSFPTNEVIPRIASRLGIRAHGYLEIHSCKVNM
jgi:hypothetical protein